MELEKRIEKAFEHMQNDTLYALELFNGILKDNPHNINALNGKGSALMKLYKNDEAEKSFNLSLSIEENSTAYLNKGIISKNNEDYGNALKYFDKALDHNPRLSSIVSILINEIIETASRESQNLDWLYYFADGANTLIKEGIELKNKNKLWDSIDCFEKAIEEDPACKHFANDLMKKVTEELQKGFLYNKPDSNKLKKSKSHSNNDSNKNKNAKIEKLKTSAIKGIFVEYNPYKSLTLINKILEIDENDADAYNLEGIAYFSLGKYERSIESFDKCLKLNDNHIWALFNKGLVLRRMRLFEESLECFNKVLENPNFNKIVKPYQEEVLSKLNFIE